MKKMTALMAITALLGLAANASAFTQAYATGDSNGSLTIGSTVKATLKLSANVNVGYDVETSSGKSQGYGLNTWHSSGSKTYGTSSGDTRIFYVDSTNYTQTTAPAAGATADFSSWTALK